jgi:hypothetical protein
VLLVVLPCTCPNYFSINCTDKFVPMLERLDREVQKGSISTYGVSVTTLDEVFQIIARGEDTHKKDFVSSHFSSQNVGNAGDADDDKSVRSGMDLEKDGLFGTHVQALLKKRAANFKRDKKAWCCTTILPSVFVLIGLLLLKFANPSGNMVPLLLDLNDYNVDVSDGRRNPIAFNNGSYFSCNPGTCTAGTVVISSNETGEIYYFCGGNSSLSGENCSISESEQIVSQIDEAGAFPFPGDVGTITEVSQL